MRHHKFDEVLTLVRHGIAVMLTGSAGSGKTTLASQIAEELNLKFYSISMTRQTTLAHLLGFLSVSGEYISSHFRECVEHGGLFLVDEIDGGDPNVLLAFNTLENGYVTFPDTLIECHKDFRLMATSNPEDEHNIYTGRAKLDAATFDRFDIIDITRDEALERQLVDSTTLQCVTLAREVTEELSMTKKISMRDAIRFQERKNLGLLNDAFVLRMFGRNDMALEKYNERVGEMPKRAKLSECTTSSEIWELLTK